MEESPLNHILGHTVSPCDVSPHSLARIVLVEDVVIAFVVHRTCSQIAKKNNTRLSEASKSLVRRKCGRKTMTSFVA
jgi:uncharacterized membrane protein YkvA (DUF1232 family)